MVDRMVCREDSCGVRSRIGDGQNGVEGEDVHT